MTLSYYQGSSDGIWRCVLVVWKEINPNKIKQIQQAEMQNDCLLLKPVFECAEWKLSSASVVYLAFFSEEKRHDGLERAASDLLIHMHKLVRAAL